MYVAQSDNQKFASVVDAYVGCGLVALSYIEMSQNLWAFDPFSEAEKPKAYHHSSRILYSF
jgi:hypothetical protein